MAATAAETQTWPVEEPESPALNRLLERLERLEPLDSPAEAVAAKVRELLPKGPVKDALSGTWLGHVVHPVLTDVPIGTWTSAVVLDLVGGRHSDPAAERLIAVGLAAAVPTVASGYSDWADTTVSDERVKRVGLVHAAANALAVSLFAGSLAARRRGARRRGKLLSLAGAGALVAGGHLGGHLSFIRGVGVDQTAFEARPADWTDVLADADLAEGQVRRADAGGVALLLTRREGRVHAMSNRCNHRGGPLDEGEVDGGCVTCPWHGSVFRLDDGSVVRGPASAPQPVWEVRVSGGRIEVRERAA